ncbi:MAG: hypothetical protein ACI4TK_10560 [Agathobacter sp.]
MDVKHVRIFGITGYGESEDFKMGEKRLPMNGKEGFLYGAVICLVTCIIMLVLNIGTAFGTLCMKEVWFTILKAVPVIWCVAMVWESFVIGRIAHKLVSKFVEPTDSFNAYILFNILFVVMLMSTTMTIIGPIVSGEPIRVVFSGWIQHWPRNFCVAFWCECLLAQPIARKVMVMIHNRKEHIIEMGDF